MSCWTNNVRQFNPSLLTETKIQILCDHVDHTCFHIVEMGSQMVQLLSAHIVGPTIFVPLTPAIAIQNVCGGSCSFVIQTRLGGVLALYMFTQYDADFMQESFSNSFGSIHIHLTQGRSFLKERVKMHICIRRAISTFCFIFMIIRMMAAYYHIYTSLLAIQCRMILPLLQ